MQNLLQLGVGDQRAPTRRPHAQAREAELVAVRTLDVHAAKVALHADAAAGTLFPTGTLHHFRVFGIRHEVRLFPVLLAQKALVERVVCGTRQRFADVVHRDLFLAAAQRDQRAVPECESTHAAHALLAVEVPARHHAELALALNVGAADAVAARHFPHAAVLLERAGRQHFPDDFERDLLVARSALRTFEGEAQVSAVGAGILVRSICSRCFLFRFGASAHGPDANGRETDPADAVVAACQTDGLRLLAPLSAATAAHSSLWRH